MAVARRVTAVITGQMPHILALRVHIASTSLVLLFIRQITTTGVFTVSRCAALPYLLYSVHQAENQSFHSGLLLGWVGRIRTCECWDQNPVPYHLATTQSIVRCPTGTPTLSLYYSFSFLTSSLFRLLDTRQFLKEHFNTACNRNCNNCTN